MDQGLLLLIEKQAVALRCIAESLLALVQSALAAETPESSLPDAGATPQPEAAPERPKVFGGGAAGEPRVPPPGPNGIVGG
jgi:hypothetical protein